MTTMISTVMVLLYSQHLVEGRATITFLDISPIAFWSGFADQKYLHGVVASGWGWWWWWWWTKPQEDPLPFLLGPKFLGLAFDLTALSHWVAPLVKNFSDFEIWIQSARVQVICWLYFQPEKFPSQNCQLEWFLIPSGFSPFPIPSCRADIWSVKPPHQQHHHHYHHYYQEGKKGRSSRREPYYTFPIPSYCAEYLGFIRCAKDCWTVETKKFYLKHLPRSEILTTRNSSKLYPTNGKFPGRCENGNPCQQNCFNLHDFMYECDCNEGFYLSSNGYTCLGQPLCSDRIHFFRQHLTICQPRTNLKICILMLNTCSGNNSSLPLESRGATQSASPSPAIAIQIEVMAITRRRWCLGKLFGCKHISRA